MKEFETEEDYVREAMIEVRSKYRDQINNTPALMSVLYDIDLLPEQITRAVNIRRFVVVCELFKRMTPEQIKSMFEEV